MTRALEFFERIADRYLRISSNPKGLHQQRLMLALNEVNIQGKSILDLGAGTGILYQAIAPVEDYLGVDFSEKMLQLGSIPIEKRRVSNIEDLKLDRSYDLIFALGLTTYLNPEFNNLFWNKLNQWTTPEAIVVVGYTNRNSIAVRAKRILGRLRIFPNTKSIGSGIPIYTTTPSDIDLKNFKIIKTIAHGHLLSKAPFISKQRAISSMYSDFLIVAKKRN